MLASKHCRLSYTFRPMLRIHLRRSPSAIRSLSANESDGAGRLFTVSFGPCNIQLDQNYIDVFAYDYYGSNIDLFININLHWQTA